MADFNSLFGYEFAPSAQIPSQFLPLNLDYAGIGTQNAPDPFSSFSPLDIASMVNGTSTTQSQSTSSTQPASSTTTAGSSANNSGTSTASSLLGGTTGLEHWFIRGVVVVLGFIFVATGLRMFGIATPVPTPVK